MNYRILFEFIISNEAILLVLCDYKKILDSRKSIFLVLFLSTILLVSFISIKASLILMLFYLCLKFYLIRTAYNTWLVSTFSFLRNLVAFFSIWIFTYDLPRLLLLLGVLHVKQSRLLWFIPQVVLILLFALLSNFIFEKLQLNQLFNEIKKKYTRFSIVSLVLSIFLFLMYEYFVRRLVYSAILLSLILMLVVTVFFVFFILIVATYYSNKQQTQYLNQSIVSLNQSYNEMQNFRHDYKNILISLSQYFEQDDYSQAKNYLYQIIDYSKNIIEPDYYSTLANLNNFPLQGLIISFIKRVETSEKKIHLQLDIEKINYQITVEQIDLVRSLSILLDNAFEAVASQTEGKIVLHIFRKENTIIFEVRNTLEHQISLEKIFKKNFTTKPNHSGRGLYSLNNILADYSNLDFEVSILQNFFIAKIFLEV
ncbi:GHKL domain-containing protein [Enterococcus sp. ALS3]|uniref:GHKL domain-containing protein n=1 Tax=Enterococcus alishanensis TaxID=1303817 RepID=A0ABS6TGP6_9ENTE|nr:GHKL domain-containing protein [Enterococcus alishanensis]MBV7392076.1 GHKL domain-containing protein [Enterococcus alishanensis]